MKIEFLMCGDPTDAFWSQAAMFRLALDALGEPYATARQVLCLDSSAGRRIPHRWSRWFDHIEVQWASSTQARNRMTYQVVDRSADLSMICDADTLLLERLPAAFLEDCEQVPAIRAVVAHYPPPLHHYPNSPNAPVTTHADMWRTLSDRILGRPITMSYRYTLLDRDVPCPFYVNHGFIAAAPDLMIEFGRQQLQVLADVRAVIDNDFCYQIAIPLAVQRGSLPHRALPMRFNFPNDSVCDLLYPEELDHVILMHYLRTDLFDRHAIFSNESDFDRFMDLSLTGSNEKLRGVVRTITGGTYPFGEG